MAILLEKKYINIGLHLEQYWKKYIHLGNDLWIGGKWTPFKGKIHKLYIFLAFLAAYKGDKPGTPINGPVKYEIFKMYLQG